MFQTNIQFPQLQQWQNRLAKIPRWAWITLGVGIVLPLVVLGISILAVALVSAAILLAFVAVVIQIRNRIQRFLRPANTGRQSHIIVHSYKVIDP